MKKISDLTPDDKNFNKGNAFGNSLIEKSMRKFGAGRREHLAAPILLSPRTEEVRLSVI